MTSPILDLAHVDCHLPGMEFPILKGTNLNVAKGDFIVLLGGNGSGKSTLLKCINGLYPISHGQMKLNDSKLNHMPMTVRAELITTLTQELDMATFSDLSVHENIAVASKVRLPPIKTLKSELAHFHVKLPLKLNEPSANLSGGERQSLALFMCFLRQPQLLLLDEHTSALDPKSAERLMKITEAQITENNTTVIMATHNLDHALKFGNRLVMMRDGGFVFEASGAKKSKLTKEELLPYYA